MKMVLLSDLHLSNHKFRTRLDDIENVQYEKLEYILNYAKKNNAIILQAGDWHDIPRSHMILLREIRLLEKYKIHVYCVFGQHDQYFRSKEHTSLSILVAAGYMTILGEEPVVLEDDHRCKVRVYGCGYGEDEIPRVRDNIDRTINILVVHRMIVTKRLWPRQEDYELADRFLKRRDGYDLILCGDAHQKFEIGIEQANERCRIICNTGPMVRKSADLWEHKPGFFLYDTGTRGIEWVEIPHESPERCMTREHLDEARESERVLKDFVDAIDSESGMGMVKEGGEDEAGSIFGDNLAAFIKANDIPEEVVNIISEAMGEKEKE